MDFEACDSMGRFLAHQKLAADLLRVVGKLEKRSGLYNALIRPLSWKGKAVAIGAPIAMVGGGAVALNKANKIHQQFQNTAYQHGSAGPAFQNQPWQI